MYEPLVSIIIPVYNGGNYLKQSIESALSQTYNNIEVIVINDGSDDNNETEQIAKKYNDKIKYLCKENGGVSSALNLGIEKMKGEWFSWLSHDDLYKPNKIESQIKQINYKELNRDKTIIACDSGLIDSNNKPILRYNKQKAGFFSGNEMFKNLIQGYSLNGCSLLVPRKALLNVKGFNTEYKFIQDWVCWLSLALEGNKFYLYNDELVNMRVHSAQQTKKISSLFFYEKNNYLNKLLNILSKNTEKKYLIKIVLFDHLTKYNNKMLRKKYKNKLIEDNLYKKEDKIVYFLKLIKGKFIYFAKRTYRFFINRIYR